MIARAFKLRFRRRMRIRKLQVEELGQQAERQLERNFFRRLERLGGVRRFVAAWVLLLVLLSGSTIAQLQALGKYYKAPQPVPGGTMSEGIVGSFTNANPLYALGPVDATVSDLIFAGLFTYDDDNNLIGDLAQSIAVDERGTTYTVKLKPRLTWHDGKPLTAEDVAFTYQLIQNPDARSPFRVNWQGITVTAVDPQTITFGLPNQLSSFPYSLTNGIVPKHILSGVSMQSLRSQPFNTSQPVGAGPFKFSALEITGGATDEREEQIALDAFPGYNGGKAKLNRFVVHSYRSEERLLEAFKKRQVTAMVGLVKVPEPYGKDGTPVYSLPMTAAVMAFFRTGSELMGDVKVRQALVQATDKNTIINDLGYPTFPVREPFLIGQLGYNPQYAQAGYNLTAAQALLDAAGWKPGKDGIREKNGKRLSLNLDAQDNSEYANVARSLQKQWLAAGVELRVNLQSTTEFQATVSSSLRTYDVLLYGIAIGKDPDVYVYWNSKNADVRAANRLNFSEYRSSIADEALQAGRTRSDASLRAVKYQPFLQAWQTDAPAVGLYQPRFLYISHNKIYGLSEKAINADVERLRSVHKWMLREADMPQETRD